QRGQNVGKKWDGRESRKQEAGSRKVGGDSAASRSSGSTLHCLRAFCAPLSIEKFMPGLVGLRTIHGDIGASEQFLCGTTVFGIARNTDAGANDHGLVRQPARCRHRFIQIARHAAKLAAKRRQISYQAAEFVAAE